MATSREGSDEGVAEAERRGARESGAPTHVGGARESGAPTHVGGARESGAPTHVGAEHEGMTPTPAGEVLEGGSIEPRILAAWREWLGALATDAEAAIAAAHVYGELAPEARDAWLDALHEDEPKLDVPKVAIYAPLLAVEADPARRERIEQAIGGSLDETSELGGVRALRGIASDGARVVALVSPLYLSFVRVLYCRYFSDEGFVWVRHEPILGDKDAPSDGAIVDNVILEATPLSPVIEELAHAVLAQSRRGNEMPRSLHLFAHLFDAHVALEDALP